MSGGRDGGSREGGEWMREGGSREGREVSGGE